MFLVITTSFISSYFPDFKPSISSFIRLFDIVSELIIFLAYPSRITFMDREAASDKKMPIKNTFSFEGVSCSSFIANPDIEMVCSRSEEHTSELQSQFHLVCPLLF